MELSRCVVQLELKQGSLTVQAGGTGPGGIELAARIAAVLLLHPDLTPRVRGRARVQQPKRSEAACRPPTSHNEP